MEFFEILERIIGHIAWPIVVCLIFLNFRNDIAHFLKRIRNAKFKNMEIDLQSEIENIRNEAEEAGITIAYQADSFPIDSISNIDQAPEWAFIKSWQEIENILINYYSSVSGLKTNRTSITRIIKYLEDKMIIDKSMAMLINKLRTTRNMIVHGEDANITRGEALEWIGISKSIKDRLHQKLSSDN